MRTKIVYFAIQILSLVIIITSCKKEGDNNDNTTSSPYLDKSFGKNGVLNESLYSPATGSTILTANDKIIVAYFGGGGETPYGVIISRYNNDGTLDKTFGNNGYTAVPIEYCDLFSSGRTQLFMKLQNDGKILVYGAIFLSIQSGTTGIIMRFQSNGLIDNSFNNGVPIIGCLSNIKDLAFYNNKILLCGSKYNAIGLICLNMDGTIDSSFSIYDPNYYLNSYRTINAINIQTDGKLFLVSTTGFIRLKLFSNLNNVFTLDNTFGNNGIKDVGALPIIIHKMSNNNYLFYDENLNYPFSLYNPEGNKISNYSTTTLANIILDKLFYATKVLSDSFNNLYLIGCYWNSNAMNYGVIKINQDGTINTSFGKNGFVSISSLVSGIEYGGLCSVVIQNDLKLLVSGSNSGIVVVRLLNSQK